MKYHAIQSFFNFTWDEVVQGFWRRYPNPYSTHVLSEDVISREVRGNKLYTKRLLVKTNKMPKWGERIITVQRHICVVEESIIDLKDNTLVTYSRNVGLSRFLDVTEKCVYQNNPEQKDSIQCDKQIWMKSSIYGLSMAIQAFAMDRYKKNAVKAEKGFNYVLNKLFSSEIEKSDYGGIAETAKLQKEKFKSTAKKAKELAKSKTLPVLANCAGEKS